MGVVLGPGIHPKHDAVAENTEKNPELTKIHGPLACKEASPSSL